MFKLKSSTSSNAAKVYAAQAAAGLCRYSKCKNLPWQGRVFCEKHIERHRARSKSYHANHLELEHLRAKRRYLKEQGYDVADDTFEQLFVDLETEILEELGVCRRKGKGWRKGEGGDRNESSNPYDETAAASSAVEPESESSMPETADIEP